MLRSWHEMRTPYSGSSTQERMYKMLKRLSKPAKLLEQPFSLNLLRLILRMVNRLLDTSALPCSQV
jgi:hypothetical protein